MAGPGAPFLASFASGGIPRSYRARLFLELSTLTPRLSLRQPPPPQLLNWNTR